MNDSSASPSSPRSLASRFYLLGSLVVTAAVFGYLARHVSAREVIALVRDADLRGLGIFLVLSLAGAGFRAWRYAVVLGASGHRAGPLPLFLVTIVRNMFSDLLPARLGTVVYVYITTTRLGIPFGAAGASFALSFLFDFFALAPMIILAAVAVGSGTGFSRGAVAAIGAVLAVGTVAVLLFLPRLVHLAAAGLRHMPLLGAPRRNRWGAAFDTAAADIARAREQGIYLRVFMLSVLVRVCKYASLYMFLFALVAPIGYGLGRLGVAPVFIGLSAAEMAASLPVSGLAGFGAYEGAWALVFRLLLFPAQLANLTSVAHHLFTQVYGYSLGALSLLILLLPVFKRPPPPPASTPAPSLPLSRAPVFYGRLAVALAAMAILIGLLYRLAPAAPQRPPPPGIASTPLDMPASNNPPPLQGFVAYEWAGGIYGTRTDTGSTLRLAERGTYPRWAPDGRHLAYWRGKTLVQTDADGEKPVDLAEAAEPHGIVYAPGGNEILFADGDAVKAVSLRDRSIRTVLEGYPFIEIDLAPGGRFIASLHTRPKYSLQAFDLVSGRNWRIGTGCSASLSPDGRLSTRNSFDHRALHLDDWATGALIKDLPAPHDKLGDNQFWSNADDWIALMGQGAATEIYVQRVSDARIWRITFCGRCDRPDLFVP